MEWISVEDRLPDENIFVLVSYLSYDDEYPCNDIAVIQNGQWHWHKGELYYDSETDECYTELVRVKITHWMPLPEPPEEKEI